MFAWQKVDYERLFRESDTKTVQEWCDEFGCHSNTLYSKGKPPRGFLNWNSRRRRAVERMRTAPEPLSAIEWSERLHYSREHVYQLAREAGVSLAGGRNG